MEKHEFKNQVEILEYILDGGYVKNIYSSEVYIGCHNGETISYYDLVTNELSDYRCVISFEDYSVYEKHIQKDTRWFMNIPEEGVLCKVYNSMIDKPTVTIIKKYNAKGSFPYINWRGNPWEFAVPFTDEELDNFKIGYKND